MAFKLIFRTVIAALLVLAIAVAVGCGAQAPPQKESAVSKEAPTPPKSTPRDQVVFNLNWLPSESVAYWAALDKGFWAEQNLDVKIIRGYGSADTISKIATKKADFGLADVGALILARSKEDQIRVKAVANHQTYYTVLVLYSKSSGVKEPKDLEGKTIVTSAGSAYRIYFPAFAKATGIDQSRVQWKFVDPALQDLAFLRGEADAWLSDLEKTIKVEKITGDPVNFFSYKKDGNLDLYGDCIIAHEDTLSQNPGLVRRFTLGFLKGFAYCLENPAEVGLIMKKYVPEADPDLTEKSWRLEVEHGLWTSNESRAKGIGWMSEERMKKTITTVLSAYDFKKEITPEMVFTTKFLPEKPVYPPGK